MFTLMNEDALDSRGLDALQQIPFISTVAGTMISPNEALDPDMESLNLYGPGQGVGNKSCGFGSESMETVEISCLNGEQMKP